MSFSLTRDSTMPLTSEFPSLVFVWPSNWGSRILTLRTAVSPSRLSSPEGEPDDDVVLLAFKKDRPRVEDGLILIEILDELDDPAFVLEFVRLVRPFVRDNDPDAAVEKAELPHPLSQGLEVELA